jgi:YhcH/YjgK/YiaL family protein
MTWIMLLSMLGLFSIENPEKNKPMENVNSEVKEWFHQGEWAGNLQIKPDESVNIQEFYVQYHKQQKLWKTAFEFLKKSNLDSLKKGRYELIPDSLYCNVDEYTTKNIEDTKHEAHVKYADIQYIIQGEEQIDVYPLQGETAVVAYNKEKDIAFYELSNKKLRLANQDVFFIFFPNDAHRPCLKTNANSNVKKIVFKVRIN